MMKRLLLMAVFLFTGLAYGQGVRYDVPPILGPTGQPLPNIAVTLCSGTGAISGASCSPQTQGFTDITLGIPCALGSPVTLTASSACQNTSDSFGNAGFWLSPGAYIFCLTGRGIAGSCYNLTVPAGSTPSGTLRSGPITAAGQVTVPDGSAAAPSYSFTNQTATGLFHPGGGSTGVSVGGVQRFNFGSNLQQDGTAGSYCFANGNPFSVACDVGISRVSAGVLAVGNGTTGDTSATVRANQAQLGGATGGNPLEIGGGNSLLHQIGTGAGNGQVWAYSIQNAGNTDLYQFGASSSTYTTGGVVGWLGNTNAFIYHSSQNFLIGAGTGTTAAINFDSTGNTLRFPSGGVLGFTSGGPSAANDTGLSRSAAGTLAIGNGTAGDFSGTLKASVTQLADGSVSAPSYSFLNETGTGLFRLGANNLGFAFGGVGAFQLFSAGIANAPASVYSWVSSFNGPRDTGISRLSANVIGVGNGLQGDVSGTLKATTVNAVSGFQVNGAALAASNLSNGVTGSGAVALASSPTIAGAVLTGPTLSSPTVSAGGIALVGSTSGGTVLQPQAVASGTISLPAATDTLVARATTDTLTNKRVTPRVVSLADGTSFTMSSDTADMNTHVNTQVAGTLTANTPTGSPTDGQKLMLRIKSTNVQTYAWNAIFRGSTTSPLPTATSGGGKTDYIGFIFNAADTKWDCIAVDMGH